MGLEELTSMESFEAGVGLNKENADGVALVKVGAKWCKPCVKVAPDFHQLAIGGEYTDVRYFNLDLDSGDDARLIQRKCGAKKIPYFAIFKKGELVEGEQTSDIANVKAMLEKHASRANIFAGLDEMDF